MCRHVTTVLHPGLYRLCYVSLTTGNVLDMGRVAAGSCPPAAPADPYVPN